MAYAQQYSGQCLCGDVTYAVEGELSNVSACHCNQCRRQSGHYLVGAYVDWNDIRIEGGENLTWFQSSEDAQRGFCKSCGSTLFWKSEIHGANIFIGTLDSPTGLSIRQHIYVADKGDYYEIGDGLPCYKGYEYAAT